MLGGHVRQGAAMATLMDVARAAGVSKATASRALQRPELVAEPTRLRVLDAAQRLGFHPNAAARALTTGRTGLVGLVVPTLSNPFFAPLVMGAQQTAEKTDHHLLIAVSEYDPTREAELADRLAEQADGLIMVTPVGTDAALRERARRVPSYWSTARWAGCPQSWPTRRRAWRSSWITSSTRVTGTSRMSRVPRAPGPTGSGPRS